MPPRAQPGGWGLCGGGLLRHKSPTTPHAANAWQWPSIQDGGAQDIINTVSNHRRRNRSPAWLLAPRSAQWSQSGAEDGTEDRLGDSEDKVG